MYKYSEGARQRYFSIPIFAFLFHHFVIFGSFEFFEKAKNSKKSSSCIGKYKAALEDLDSRAIAAMNGHFVA
jgi:hypothetical protein